MAAGTVTLYGAAKENIAKALLDLDSSTFQVVLTTASYTPVTNTHGTWADVSANEVAAGGGYTAGGATLASITVNRSAGTVTFDAADVSWAASTITAKYAVIVKKAGGSLVSGDLLLCYVELEAGGTVSTTNGTLSIAWNASGIFTLS
jgi:hypothetical protein